MKQVLIVWLLLTATVTYGQNLVQNPGIDLYTTCPGFGQFGSTWIPFWEKPSIGSSDYYHYNCAGIQPALQPPRSGEGYAGIICYNFGTEYREYITGTFSSPLIAGMVYDVEFWVSLHNGYIQAIEEVGAYISNTAPGPFGNSLHINVIPQVENISGALDDTANWKPVYGQYMATGGEEFITIGNFHDDAGTTITQPGTTGSFGTYYFVDDVSVSLVPSTGINHADNGLAAQVFADASAQIHIVLKDHPGNAFPALCRLLDMAGREIFRTVINERHTILSQSTFQPGIYFIQITGSSGFKQTQKLFIGEK